MMEDRVQELERRLTRAEETITQLSRQVAGTNGVGTQLVAPVRVVNMDGIPLLEISNIHNYAVVRLFDSLGQIAVILGTDDGGGYLAIYDKQGIRVGYLNVESSGARLLIEDHEGEGGVVLFGGNDDGGSISILPKGVREGISLSSTSAGGEVRLYNNTMDEPVIIISASDTGGRVETADVNNDGSL